MFGQRSGSYKTLTFVCLINRLGVAGPGRVAMVTEVAQFQVADGETDDGRLIQLARDGRRKGKQFCQLVELVVFFSSSRARRVT